MHVLQTKDDLLNALHDTKHDLAASYEVTYKLHIQCIVTNGPKNDMSIYL